MRQPTSGKARFRGKLPARSGYAPVSALQPEFHIRTQVLIYKSTDKQNPLRPPVARSAEAFRCFGRSEAGQSHIINCCVAVGLRGGETCECKNNSNAEDDYERPLNAIMEMGAANYSNLEFVRIQTWRCNFSRRTRFVGIHEFCVENLSTYSQLCGGKAVVMRYPAKLLRILGLPLICLAFFGLAGGHWLMFQTIAWAQMLQDYSRNASITEAIAKTFSGRSPCDMCTRISEEQQREGRTPAVVKFDKKAEVFLLEFVTGLKAPQSEDYSYFRPQPSEPIKRSDSPPAPIPIFA